MSRSYHNTVLSGKLQQDIRQATDREGGVVSSQTTNALKPGDRLQRSYGRSTRTCRSPLWKTSRAQP